MTLSRLVTVGMAACVFYAVSALAADAAGFPPLNHGTSVTKPAGEFKFQSFGAKGVDPKTEIQAANVFGDFATGQHGSFFTFTPGFVSPVHSHTYDYYAVVIKGELENFEPGVAPVKLGPGSYWYQRGKKAHTTSCVSRTVCEIFIVQAQKFDAQIPPVEE
jgi:quercetin dioxygenase-like cupin family protein